MKKTRFIALFITAAMITTSAVSIPAYAQETATPGSSVGNTTVEWENKLGDPVYAEVLRSADESEKFAVTVYITDTLDPQAIEKEAMLITGIDIEKMDTVSENEYNELYGMEKQLAEEFYLNENSKILSKLAVADEDVVTIDTHSASLTLNLTKSEIERIAAFNDVKTINLDISEEDMPVYEDTSPYNKKIDRDSLVPLLEKAEEGEKFTVWVWVVDRTNDEAICAQVRSRMIADGSWENYTNPEYDNWDDTSKMISDSRRLQDEVYKQENPKIAAALELADEDIIEIGTQAPLFTLDLTKSEIERIAENAYVTHIDYIDLNARGDIDEAPGRLDPGDYNRDGYADSADALALLRGSVDNKEFTQAEIWHCDLDGDGIITSNDALLVLRKSVGYSD